MATFQTSQGCTLQYAVGAGSYATLGNVTAITGVTAESTDIDTTDFATTGFKTYIKGVSREGGDVSVTFNWDTTAAGNIDLLEALLENGDTGAAADNITWRISNGTILLVSFEGYVKNIAGPDLAADDIAKATLTIKISGGSIAYNAAV